MEHVQNTMYLYRLVFLLVISIYIFSPVIMDWWIDPGSSWFRPYAIWLVLIGLSVWLEQRRSKHDI